MRNRGGFTLLELLLALTMLGVLALGITGWTQGIFRVQTGSAMRLGNQSDINQFFSVFSKAIKLAASQKDLAFTQTLTSTSTGSNSGKFSMTLTVKDGESTSPTPDEFYTLTEQWDPNNSGNTVLTGVPDSKLTGGENLRIELRNFEPYVRLKDYDGSGTIDDTDKAKQKACMNLIDAGLSTAACFDNSCGNVANLNLATASSDCIKKSAIPFMEFSEDRKIIYVSVMPVRSTSSTRKIKGRGITKAIMLEQA